MVFKWDRHGLQSTFDVFPDRSKAAATDVGSHVDVTRDGVTLDNGGRRRDAYLGQISQGHLAAVWRVDQQLVYVGQAIAELGHTPDQDVEDLLLFIEVSDVEACQ